ncbi:MAG: AMP-binding protein [Clostridia bacterium]|nr:AMP-binding protein [Clostridia bacterium]
MIHRFCRTDFDSYEDFFTNFTVDMPEAFNFGYDIADELAAAKPDKTAVVWCNDIGEEKIISFAEIKRMSDRYANALLSLGIRKGDMVMVMLRRRYEYWYFAIAMHKIGAVLIPATHLLTVKDLVYRIETAGIKMILTVPDHALCDKIDEARAKTGNILETRAVLTGERDQYVNFCALANSMADSFTRPTGADAPDSRDVMIAYFTSGTTAMPKMVAHDYYYPLCHLTTAKFWHDLDEADLHLTVADTGWAKASWGKLYGQWICEAAVFVYDFDKRFKPSDFLTLIDKYQITSFCAPPTIYRFLIKEDLSRFNLSSLKKASIAGEPLNPEVYAQWLAATGLKLREGYGQTECTILIATNRWSEPKPGSMGLPMPLTNCAILDDDGRECEVGEVGEICMPVLDPSRRPLGLFMGYYKDEERTRSVLYDGVYHTGDMAWRDEDGYIWFNGRNDDIIKSSGYRIGPFEVESALIEHPAVLETAVTAVPDPDRGSNVKATIVLAKGYEPSDALKKELQDHVKRVTAPYKYPRIVEFVTELPKTISGKIRRVEIRQGDVAEGDGHV